MVPLWTVLKSCGGFVGSFKIHSTSFFSKVTSPCHVYTLPCHILAAGDIWEIISCTNTVMRCLMMGIHSEKCMIRQFCCCTNTIEWLCTKTPAASLGDVILQDHLICCPLLTQTSVCSTWLECETWSFENLIDFLDQYLSCLRLEQDYATKTKFWDNYLTRTRFQNVTQHVVQC